jgi:outer membrane protein
MKISSTLGLAVLLGASAYTPALAQSFFAGPTGYQSGDVLAHASLVGVIPQDFTSHVDGIGGHVHASAQAAPEVDLSYFLTPNWSVEAIAASTRHEVTAEGTALGKVDVGATWVLPPTLTLQYHLPQMGMVRPYAGVGVTFAFFYGTQPARPTVTKFALSTGVGPALDAGFDVPLTGRWVANFDVKQIFVTTDARIDTVLGPVKAHTSLSPTVVGAGVGYQF